MSGDPATHVSHAPVMMDGSCNGLQHYAALGLDKEGGSSVNMVRAGKPQVSCTAKYHLSYMAFMIRPMPKMSSAWLSDSAFRVISMLKLATGWLLFECKARYRSNDDTQADFLPLIRNLQRKNVITSSETMVCFHEDFLLHLIKLGHHLQDVYSEVARLVKQSAKLDAVNGSILAQKLLPFLDRSLVKQTVMTSVYGVTMLGQSDLSQSQT